MKFLKYLVLVILGLIAIYIIACLSSNKITEVVVKRELSADLSTSFTAVNDFNHYQNWNEWSKMDTAANFEVVGSSNVGDKFQWDGEEIGTGYLVKESSEPNKSIHNHMVFTAPWESEGEDLWAFADVNGKTMVTWTTKSEAPWYMRPIMTPMLSGTMEKGLDNLAAYLETMPVSKNGVFIKEKMDEMKYLGIRNKIAASDLVHVLTDSYEKLGTYCNENGIEMAGMPMAIYYTWENDSTDVVAAFPVSETVEGTDGIDFGIIPAANTLSTVHYGTPESTEESHEGMYAFFMAKNLEMGGPVYEIYLTDPTIVEAELNQTKIIYPIAEAPEVE